MPQKLSSLGHHLILIYQLFNQKTIANRDGYGLRWPSKFFLCSFAAALCYQGLVKQNIFLSKLTDQFQIDFSAQVTSLLQGLPSSSLLILLVVPYTCSAQMSPSVRYLLLILIPDMAIRADLCQKSTNWGRKTTTKQP